MASPVRYDDFDNETEGFPEKLKRVFADIALRLVTLEAIGSNLTEIEQRYGTAALDRINAVVLPLVTNIEAVLNDAAVQLSELENGTAPDAQRLGAELPGYYLALANSIGILDVNRGGTGGGSGAEAIINLGITPAAIGARTAAQITAEINAAIAGVDAVSQASVTAEIATAIDALIDGAPGALDTLNELAAALNDNASYASTITAQLASKVDNTRWITAGDGLNGGGSLAADRTLSLQSASATQFRAAQAGVYALTAQNVWSAAEEVALPYAATVAVNMSNFINAVVTLSGNAVLGTPSNTLVGRGGFIRIVQDATGGRTLGFAAGYEFEEATPPEMSTAANAETTLFYSVRSTGTLIMAVGNVG